MSPHPRLKRLGSIVALCVVALELLYLLVGNLVVSTGILRHFTNVKPEEFTLTYRRAWTLWPAHVQVSGLTARFQDANIQFLLELDSATIDIRLSDLLFRKFHATRVRAEGASWRMLHKVWDPKGQEERLEAFPIIYGFARPPLRAKLQGPPADPADIARLWAIELDDIDATVREFWMLEYCYEGRGHVAGSFRLQPLTRLWVGPAQLTLDQGTLTAGQHAISSRFQLQAEVTVKDYAIPDYPGLLVFRPISASVQLQAPLVDLGAAQLYLPGLTASGSGTLKADLRLVAGEISPLTVVELQLPVVHADYEKLKFDGKLSSKGWVEAGGKTPRVHASAQGTLTAPVFQTWVTAKLSGLGADLLLSTNDLAAGLELGRLRADLAEARVEDARPLQGLIGSRVPIIGPAVLGGGPLLVSAAADLTPQQTLVRLKSAQLGGASLRGAALNSPRGWNGAAAGHFGVADLGLRLRDGKLQVQPFMGGGQWLEQELSRVGINPAMGLEASDSRHTGADCPTCPQAVRVGGRTSAPQKHP